MKIKKSLFTLITAPMFIFIASVQINAADSKIVFTDLYGDYLGQTPPGDTPVVFAPGFISRKSLEHGPAIFSADGNEVYWCSRKSTSEWLKTNIWFMKRINNRWTKPEKFSSFRIDVAWMDPFLSMDGKRLYFSADSNTIKEKGMSENENRDIWFVEKQNDGWSKPQKISPVIDTIHGQSQPTLTQDGTVYFLEYNGEGKEWKCDIFKSKLINGDYLQPVALPDSINLPVKQASQDWTPFIAPDDSYLIFSSTREQKYGDLYISFHDMSNDRWSEPVGMGESINTESQESYPTVSPDGKYLFFTRYNDENKSMDVYWVSAGIIEKLKEKVFQEVKLTEELFKAVDAGDLAKVKSLIKSNKNLLEIKDRSGSTPLIRACLNIYTKGRQVEVAKFLIEAGANVNVINNYQATALLRASVGRGPDYELIKLLVAKGADVNIQGYNGITALHWAVKSNDLKVAKFLLENGADINISDDYNEPIRTSTISGTVLQVAINLSQSNEMFKFVIENGAKLNCKDSQGNTELHLVALKGNTEQSKFLIEHGIDLNALNNFNRTALYYAAKHGYRGVAELLIASGADKNTIVETNYGKAKQLSKSLDEGEAFIWNLGFGYAVKTKNNLLVFTLLGGKIGEYSESSLANGFLNADELKDQKMTIFLRHRGNWPMDGKRFTELAKLTSNVKMVSSIKPDFSKMEESEIPPYHLAIPNERFSVDGIKVHTIPALASGMGYLVEVDGLKIFHAGLHISDDKPEHIEKYRKEIDFLKPFGPIDIVMLPTHSHSNYVGTGYEQYLYLLDQLEPKAIYLWGANVPEQYVQCADFLKVRNIPIVYPELKQAAGERYHYTSDQTQKK